MFWGNKDKKKNKKTDKRAKKDMAGCVGSKSGQSSESEKIRAQALANLRGARENLGNDTIEKIAEMIKAKENSAIERAKRDIQNADPDKVLEELKWMLDNRD